MLEIENKTEMRLESKFLNFYLVWIFKIEFWINITSLVIYG